MMVPSLVSVLIFCYLLRLTNTERRITDGKPADNKRYAVYLVKRENSKQLYDEWMCGGAIVSPVFVVTSAACIEDVEFLYVIAGYKKYVHPDKLNEDPCTKTHKKKVIYVCVPSVYKFSYPEIEKWSWADIAVAKVESPFDFNDKSYLNGCSYIPNKIAINYEKKYQEPGIDTLALGWGHQSIWRSQNDTRDLNSDILLGASLLIEEKPICKKEFGNVHPKLLEAIDRYMICTMRKGNIGPDGSELERTNPEKYVDGCEPDGPLRGSGLCHGDFDEDFNIVRRDNTNHTHTQNAHAFPTRRDGICQNDHGGPLVTWVGAHEVLIGVASVFRVNSTTNHCIGPYLFTSTWCSSAFLYCIIEGADKTRRRNVCDKRLKKEGLTLIEREVSWVDHPDGPAENELIKMRPQISLNEMYRQVLT